MNDKLPSAQENFSGFKIFSDKKIGKNIMMSNTGYFEN